MRIKRNCRIVRCNCAQNSAAYTGRGNIQRSG
nr:MAG TPA: hypothetical protein [Caudoviricetes sp.]